MGNTPPAKTPEQLQEEITAKAEEIADLKQKLEAANAETTKAVEEKEEIEGDMTVLRTDRDRLQRENEILAKKVLKVQATTEAYEFHQPDPDKPWLYFDGLRHKPEKGFFLHEQFPLSNDSGYANYLFDRAQDTIRRAFARQRTGAEYEALPPFSRGNVLNVLVYVEPAEG